MTNQALKWDTLKCEIRGFTLAYATAKKKEKIIYERDLRIRIETLEKNLDENNYLEYKTIQSQLEQVQKEYTMGAQIRSKAKSVEETEQNITYFKAEEKKNYNVRYIRSLYRDDDTITSDPKEILEEEEKYYKMLYSKPDNQIIDTNLFQHPDIPKLSQEDLEICDATITLEELGKALRNLPNNKTPGTDGLTSEFYKFFWVNIKDLVFSSLKYAYTNGSLSIEQRRGILALIPKKDKDFRKLKNWRPLTLLNTDYKILTKLLAARLQKVIAKLIKKDQTGYIKGRYIGENIRTLYDMVEISSIYNLPGMVVTLDFEKAFDSVSWDFLLKSLQAFGFGPIFSSWIKTLYTGPQICVMNNGYNSQFFSISRGIRQGCPISALLFILVVEIMAIHIRGNSDISGIRYSEKDEVIISQLADDTTLFLSDTQSLINSIAFITKFGKSSGLKLNKDKTEAFWIGADMNKKEKPLGLSWTKDFIKCLGIWCGPSIEGAVRKNFEEKIKKIKSLLNLWSQRNLSLKGKVSVLRSIVLPQILYTATTLYIPEEFQHEIDNLFFDFLWYRKKPHVKREVVINEISKGGLKMPLFSGMVKAMKVTWIKRILSSEKSRQNLLNKLVVYRNKNIDYIIRHKLDTKFMTVKNC